MSYPRCSKNQLVDYVMAVGILILAILFFLLYADIENGWAQDGMQTVELSAELKTQLKKEIVPQVESLFKDMHQTTGCEHSRFSIVLTPNLDALIVMRCETGKEEPDANVRFLPPLHSRRGKAHIVQTARHARRT